MVTVCLFVSTLVRRHGTAPDMLRLESSSQSQSMYSDTHQRQDLPFNIVHRFCLETTVADLLNWIKGIVWLAWTREHSGNLNIFRQRCT